MPDLHKLRFDFQQELRQFQQNCQDMTLFQNCLRTYLHVSVQLAERSFALIAATATNRRDMASRKLVAVPVSRHQES